MVAIPAKYFDQFGLIVTANKDGGDCAARMGLWMMMTFLLFKLKKITSHQYLGVHWKFVAAVNGHLEKPRGLFIRHPSRSPTWRDPEARDFARWNDWMVFSRDQRIGLSAGLYYTGMVRSLKDSLYGLKKRHGIDQNGDLSGPSHWGFFNRLGFAGIFANHLGFCDFTLFIGTVIQWWRKDASDAINGSIMLIVCNNIKPTFWSKASLWFAKTFDNYQKYYDEYFGNPKDPGAPFHIYCKPVLKEYFG